MLINKLSLNKLLRLQFSDRYSLWRIIYMVVVGGMTAGAILVFYFIYQNIFATISNAYAIGILNTQLNIDAVDISSYNKAREIIQAKGQLTKPPAALRNIFFYAPSATSSSHAKPSKQRKK